MVDLFQDSFTISKKSFKSIIEPQFFSSISLISGYSKSFIYSFLFAELHIEAL